MRSLREEVRQLRDELNAVKNAASTNAATLKSVSEKVKDAATQSDLEALRDIEDENTLRSIGSSSSLSSYTVNGNQHLVNLTGFGQLGIPSLPGSEPGHDRRVLPACLRLQPRLELASLRNNTGAEGDVQLQPGGDREPDQI